LAPKKNQKKGGRRERTKGRVSTGVSDKGAGAVDKPQKRGEILTMPLNSETTTM